MLNEDDREAEGESDAPPLLPIIPSNGRGRRPSGFQCDALPREGLGARFIGAREGEGPVPVAGRRFPVGCALGGADAFVDPMLDVEIAGRTRRDRGQLRGGGEGH